MTTNIYAYIILAISLITGSNALAQNSYNPALPPSSTNYVEGDIYYEQTLVSGEKIGIIFDIEGNEYPVSTFNNIWWTTWHMRSTTYSDGTKINGGVLSATTDASVAQFCYPSPTGVITKSSYWDRSQGLLYNHRATVNKDIPSVNEGNVLHEVRQGICPTGWHVPSDVEFTAFVDALSPPASAATRGTLIRSATRLAGTMFNPNGTSASSDMGGFNVSPVGYAENGSAFNYNSGYIWTSSAYGVPSAWVRDVFGGSSTNVIRQSNNRISLLSVRCQKD